MSLTDTTGFVTEDENEDIENKLVWNKALSDEYRAILSSLDVVRKFDNVVNGITNDSSDMELDCCVHNFVMVLDSVYKPLFEKPCRKQSSFIANGPRLYSKECELKKIYFFRKLNVYRADKSNENRS